jgi:hypothetical protein
VTEEAQSTPKAAQPLDMAVQGQSPQKKAPRRAALESSE